MLNKLFYFTSYIIPLFIKLNKTKLKLKTYMGSNSSQTKGYLTLLGSIITNIILGNSTHWLSFISYYLKYYYNNNNNNNPLHKQPQPLQLSNLLTSNYVIHRNESYYILATIFLSSNISNALSPYFTFKRNIRTILSMSFFLIICSYLIIYYTTNDLVLIIIAFSIYGIGIGLPYQALMRNVWKYFPQLQNVISFINVISFSISAPLFTYIQRIMLLNQIKHFLWMCIILYTLCGVVSTAISFDYTQDIIEHKCEENTKHKQTKSNNVDLHQVLLHSRTNSFIHSRSVSYSEREFNMKHIHPSESNVISIAASRNSKRSSINSMNTNINKMITDDSESVYKGNAIWNYKTIGVVFRNKNIYYILLYYMLVVYMIYAWLITISIFPQKYSLDTTTSSSNNIIIYLIYGISISRIIAPFVLCCLSEVQCVWLFGVVQLGLALFIKDIVISFNERILYLCIGVIGLLYSGHSILISNIVCKIYGNDIAFVLSGIVIGIGTCMVGVVCLVGVVGNNVDYVLNGGVFTTICGMLVYAVFVKVEEFDYSKGYTNERVHTEEREMNSNEEVNGNNEDVFDMNSVNDVKSENTNK